VTFLDPVLREGVGEQTAENQEMPDPAAQSPTASQQNHSDDTDTEDVAQTQSGSEWGRDSGDFSISIVVSRDRYYHVSATSDGKGPK
jgi:hypothetical protein